MIKAVYTEKAPQAIGPYSQAIKAGDFLFLSGQIPVNPETNEVVENDIVVQTRQVMRNIQAILEKEGLTFENIVKTTIFVKDLSMFATVNEEYGKFLGDHRPARSTVEISRLPKDVLIEIEAIAYTGNR
ncbi:endoribonuclease [Collibacillus ludicampi]|jgi:2-iminobutanoate/2-iminopropanoate deaminase|uniref:Endoribonuclease n=1 Tax=Collibacillus ludicampi TaxID=2771369 RepID=A0AAV4LCP1_9BACL|nr:RidA family protein [Collibacillus ludicampi]GIM45207.1 endoribonuclease [Collibacillus ludicampi]